MKKGLGKRTAAIIMVVVMIVSLYIPSYAAESSSFTYEIISDSTKVRITGYKGSDEHIIIPDSIDGRTVVEISEAAFEANNAVRTVTISSNVLKIMKNAFRNCALLQTVVIPASVTSIGDSAFAGCVSLTSVSITSASTTIGSSAFEGCTALNSVTIPSTTIGYAAFRNCISLENINLLDSVQVVDRRAFDGTAWYNKQPEGLLILGKVVYSYTGKETDVVIPEGVRCIAYYAFSGTPVENVVLPDGLYYIGVYAFYECDNLTYISIPSSIISIGTSAIGYTENGRLENFKVYCYKDSVAMNWASNNSIDYELIDDCAHSYSDWVVTVEPDCTSGGAKYRRCVRCNNIENVEIKENGHSFSGWITVSELSCTTDEVKRRTCTVCGENEDSVKLTKGHSWGSWTVVANPGCTENGEQVHTCTVCEATETQSIDPTGHIWIVNESTDKDGWSVVSEPSCATAGVNVRICAVCAYAETLEIEGPGHTAFEWTVITDPTSVTTGVKEGVCTVCGETFTAEIPMITEELPDDVKMLTLVENASIVFNDTRTCVKNVSAETTVTNLLLEFNYPGHIIVADEKVVNQLEADDIVPTGSNLILVRFNESTQQYDFVDAIRVSVKGDVQCDGKVSAADARLALRTSAGLESLSEPAAIAADIDGDGKVTASDARKILRVASKLDTF